MRLVDFVIHAAELVLKMDGDDTLTLHDESLTKTIKVSVTLEKVEVLSCWEGTRRVPKPYWTEKLEAIILILAREQAHHIQCERSEQRRLEREREDIEFQYKCINWGGSTL